MTQTHRATIPTKPKDHGESHRLSTRQAKRKAQRQARELIASELLYVYTGGYYVHS